MKTKSLIIIAVGLILSGTASIAQAGTQRGDLRNRVNTDLSKTEKTVYDPDAPGTFTVPDQIMVKKVSCEDKLEALKQKSEGLQCELDYFECLAAGKSVFACKVARIGCDMERMSPDSPDANDSGILDGGPGEDFIQNHQNQKGLDLLDHAVLQDNVNGVAGRQMPTCEDKLETLKKENEKLQCEIDCYESSTTATECACS